MKGKTPFIIMALAILALAVAACKVSYKFTGTSIDYTKTKTISLDKFPIRANYVWSPMESMFYNELSDAFAQKTKLTVLKKNGDLQLSGEIVEYSQTNKSIASDGFSAQTQLKMTVNVRFVNNINHDEDFEQRFSATTSYDSSQQLAAVQEGLVTEMIKDIVDQIFNATVANW
ncbi:MAG: LPS assembly lipoprotein LptE [Bacteroidaceae bacterium]|nr:LPS assembly lipoprotein LptE [Bacteroidaceae bacterium]